METGQGKSMDMVTMTWTWDNDSRSVATWLSYSYFSSRALFWDWSCCAKGFKENRTWLWGARAKPREQGEEVSGVQCETGLSQDKLGFWRTGDVELSRAHLSSPSYWVLRTPPDIYVMDKRMNEYMNRYRKSNRIVEDVLCKIWYVNHLEPCWPEAWGKRLVTTHRKCSRGSLGHDTFDADGTKNPNYSSNFPSLRHN